MVVVFVKTDDSDYLVQDDNCDYIIQHRSGRYVGAVWGGLGSKSPSDAAIFKTLKTAQRAESALFNGLFKNRSMQRLYKFELSPEEKEIQDAGLDTTIIPIPKRKYK